MSTTAAPAIEQPIDAPITVLPVQPGDYTNVAWLDTDRLVVQYRQDHIKNFSATQLGLVTFTSTTIHPLDLPPHPLCADHLYSSLMPVQTPTHQIAYLSRCALSSKDGLQDYPMLYDPATATASPLRADKFDPIKVTGSVSKAQSYSFFPDLQSGLLVDTWMGEQKLHQFNQHSVTRIELDYTNIGDISLAPDGTQAVLITQDGRPGLHLLDEPYTVRLADPQTWDDRALFTEYFTHSVSWSPDGRHFSIVTSATHDATQLLWIVNRETGTRKQVAQGRFNSVAWSPDGSTMAIIQHIGTSVLDSRTEIALLDLSQVDLP